MRRFVGWLIACACASAKVHVDPGPTEKMDSSGSLQRELSVEETDKVESVLDCIISNLDLSERK